MRNHPLYKQLRQIALDNNYTVEQIQNCNWQQAVQLLGQRDFSIGFLENAKRELILELRNEAVEVDRQYIASAVRDRFPQLELEYRREGEYPYIMLWLKGKPGEQL